MKSNWLVFALAIAFGLSFAGSSLADEFTGKVTELDAEKGSVKVKKMPGMKKMPEAKMPELKVPEVTLPGMSKTFAADAALLEGIQEGDRIKVTYEKVEDTNKASAIELVLRTFEGKVDAVDAAAGTLKVKKSALPKPGIPSTETTLPLMTKEFTAESSLLEGIAVGDKVVVSYKKDGDTRKVTKVEKK